ncbi:MAG: PAS domain-containing protein [Woeseia sp.]
MNTDSQIDIIETLPVIVWSAQPGGAVDFISSDILAKTGRESLQPHEWLDLLHPDDRERTMAVWSRAVETGEPYDIEFRIQWADGDSYRWHLVQALPHRDEGGEITGWFGVAIDIQDRYRTESALASARQQTRLILESSGEGIHGIDLEGRVTFTNSRAAEILGYRPEELIGLPSHQTIHHSRADGSPYPQDECRIYRTLNDGRTRQMTDDAFIARDKTVVPVDYTVAAITDPETDKISGAVINFREVRAERSDRLLRELEAKVLDQISRDQPLSTVLDEVTRCIETFNPRLIASILLIRDNRLVHGSAPSLPEAYNQAVDGIKIGEAVGSCGAAAYCGKPVIDSDLQKDPNWADYRELAAHHGLGACWSTPVIDGNGRVLATFAVYHRQPCVPRSDEIELIERVTRFVGLAIERSEQRRILQESEERFRAVATASSDVIWDWDLISDRIWWSEGIEKQFNYRIDELPRHSDSWTQMIHPEDLDWVLESIHRVIDTGAEEWREEYRIVTADGRELLTSDSGRVIRNESGQAVRMVGSMVDVTEIRRMEQQLQQARRLEAIGQLTGGIAHDFNNLLTVIMGSAELLANELDENGGAHDLAEMIRSAAAQGADLTKRLLAFARKQALEPRPTDVNQLISDMDHLLRRSLGENIEIETIRAGGLWPAIVDPGQLESALLNLCINARDAMEQGGKLTIETANARLDNEYAAAGVDVTPGQYVQISVSDTGTGMDEQTLTRAFEPFYTTKKDGRGNGLGLSMVHGFANQSGGHVRIYSELSQGTAVKLYLPRSEDKRGVNPRREVSGTAISSGSETILVVEDNDMVRSHVENLLASLGYTVISAGEGGEALEIIESDEEIDLLFTDVVMPGGMSGRQLADQARKARPELPVLYTSGYTENAIVHHGRLDPGVHLLQKPYRREELSSKIRKVLAEVRGK